MVFYYWWEDVYDPRHLDVVPYKLHDEILEKFHDHSYAGHTGRDNTGYNI